MDSDDEEYYYFHSDKPKTKCKHCRCICYGRCDDTIKDFGALRCKGCNQKYEYVGDIYQYARREDRDAHPDWIYKHYEKHVMFYYNQRRSCCSESYKAYIECLLKQAKSWRASNTY